MAVSLVRVVVDEDGVVVVDGVPVEVVGVVLTEVTVVPED